MTTELPELMTIEQVAEYYQASKDTVRRWIREGVLPAYRVGSGRGAIRVKKEDALAILGPFAPGEDAEEEDEP